MQQVARLLDGIKDRNNSKKVQEDKLASLFFTGELVSLAYISLLENNHFI